MAHFSFRYGNPYIAFTEKEKNRILKKYGKKAKQIDTSGKFYFIDNSEF
jgi:hypothetical protein